MSPLELEIYHQVKNVIGVNPSFYEYLFTVDADTTADENALNFLISACVPPSFRITPLLLTRYGLPLSQYDQRQEGHRLLRRDVARQRKAVTRNDDAGASSSVHPMLIAYTR
jgi:hypothetical protein